VHQEVKFLRQLCSSSLCEGNRSRSENSELRNRLQRLPTYFEKNMDDCWL